MRVRARVGAVANKLLEPFDLKLIRSRVSERQSWDEIFEDWIARARKEGRDPNDIGDRAWEDDNLDVALDRYYLSLLKPDSVAVELGPGTGRLSRHLIRRCSELILVDYSKLVCEWLGEYLKGKGRFRVVHITTPTMSAIESDTADAIFAHGVFEHLDLEDAAAFLGEFHRVSRPGATTIFNFDQLMSPGGLEWFHRWRPTAGERCIFRFFHPDMMARVGEDAGFEVVSVNVDNSRLATIALRKPLDSTRPGVTAWPV